MIYIYRACAETPIGMFITPKKCKRYSMTMSWYILENMFLTPPLFCRAGKTRTKDKYRIVYSEYQKVELEKEYMYSKYITIQRKAELSRAIALSERQVKIWFQNRRAKERKQKRKRDEAVTATPTTTDMVDGGGGVLDPMDDRIKSETCDMHMRVHVH